MARYRPFYTERARPNASRRWYARPPAANSTSPTQSWRPTRARGAGDQAGPGRLRRHAALVDDHADPGHLGRLVGFELEAERFRPNLLVERSDRFREDAWVGRVLRIGGMGMRVDVRDPRCVIVTIDPRRSTGRRRY